MFSTICKNQSLQNIAKNLIKFNENQSFVRCISKSNEVNNSDFLRTTKDNTPKTTALKEQLKIKKTARTLSTLNHSVPRAASRTVVSKDESREFMSVFPDLVRDLTEYAKKRDDSIVASKWFTKALQYNVPQGKKNRGLATITAFKSLAKPEDLTAENLRLAHYLGWCVEMLQSMFLIVDDIMDKSEIRRGQPCWYKIEEVGMISINDALMIENGIYYILKKYFSEKDYYLQLIELFHEIIFITLVGQSLDTQTANANVDNFTMERYKRIVANKTSYYTFYLPVALAMHMSGKTDPEIFRQAKTILLEMGHFFQVQDDFLDSFGDPQVTGKIGTDVQEGKCTWLSVLFMQRASAEQKEIFKDCYGKADMEKVNIVKKMYKDLGLPNTYAIYEEDSFNMIKTHIQQTSKGLKNDIFFKILETIYRRDC